MITRANYLIEDLRAIFSVHDQLIDDLTKYFFSDIRARVYTFFSHYFRCIFTNKSGVNKIGDDS